MSIDKFNKQFSNEDKYRHFLESVIWDDGRKYLLVNTATLIF
jgi:hypothetical protein